MAAQDDAIKEWRERFARLVLRVDFKPLSDLPFRASVSPIFNDLHIARTMHSPGTTFRDEELVRDGNDHFSLLISQARNLDVSHRGRDLRLGRGDATLMHLCETGSVGSRDDVGYIAVIVPPEELEARCAGPDGAVMKWVPQRSEALYLLRSYIHTLETGKFRPSSEARETIRRHIIDLVALAIAPHGTSAESSGGAVVSARLAAARECIANRFNEPALTVAAVARSQSISPRYLQRLIETSGTSFTDYVNELRLLRAFSLLTEAHGDHLRISEIALQVGFSDISHFNRLFRARFGDTPSGVRARNRAEP